MAADNVDFGQILREAAHLLWQRRLLWGLGVLAVVGSGLVGAGVRLLFQPVNVLSSDRLPRLLISQPPAPLLVGLATGAFLLFVLLWLLALWAEGSLIWAVGSPGAGQSVRAGEALRAGWRLLFPFVALDTLLFFPLFLLLLVAMVVISVILVGLIWQIGGGGQIDSALGSGVLAAGICLLPLLCLMLPVTAVTYLLRTLALRVVALEGRGARAGVRRAWALLRHFPGSVLIMAMLLGGVGYAVSLLLGLLVLPVQGVVLAPGLLAWLAGGEPPGGALALPLLLGGLVALMEISVRAGVHAFSSTGWTVTYRALVRLDAEAQSAFSTSREQHQS